MRPGAGADVDQVIAVADAVFVVLDHEHRVTNVAKSVQRADEPRVVALVKADRRFIEHIAHTDQTRTNLRRQTDALRLAPGEGAGFSIQREISESHIDHEPESRADFLDN